MKASPINVKLLAILVGCYIVVVLAFAVVYGGSTEDERAREENDFYRRLAEKGTKQPADPTDEQRNAILYGVSQDLKEDAVKEPEPPYVPTTMSTGEFRVKIKPGWQLHRDKYVSRLFTPEGKDEGAAVLMAFDYEYPDSIIEPLFGEENIQVMAKLKERGEKMTGRSLPDLGRWFRVIPDPGLLKSPVVSAEMLSYYAFEEDKGWKLRRAQELLTDLPGVLSVHAVSPMIPSSTYHNLQYQLAPFTGPTDGDLDFDRDYPTLGGYAQIQCSVDGDNELCSYGGLNVIPAWDRGFRGEDVPIGYVEGGWCIDGDAEIDVDRELLERYDLTTQAYPECGQHPAFNGTDFAYVTPNNLKGYYSLPVGDIQFHGTAVLGIMAADSGSNGTSGISPRSRYYIGQAMEPAEWLDIINRLVNDPNGLGAPFLLEYPMLCNCISSAIFVETGWFR